MIQLPRRPAPYIVTLLLIVLIILVTWMFRALDSPEIRNAARRKGTQETAPAPGYPSGPSAAARVAPAPVVIDPVHAEMASRLHAAGTPPQEDLKILVEFLNLYSRARGGNPVGQNEDITAALTGTGGMSGRVFPPVHPAIRNGQLIDRWGTPYWFHPNTGNQMEIRSAGPDRNLFTPDDVVLNPSPAGLGATPQGTQKVQ